jgi:thiol-disulfide isomerase/thioredoxin
MNGTLKQFRLLAIGGIAMIAAVSPAQAKKYLNIGDPAPSIQSVKWVKGAPIPTFQKGRVYVVEFWATWCGPCKESIPHLTDLAKKYKDTVSVAGISIWESNDPKDATYMPKVEKFVKDQGDRMDYHVAADLPGGKIGNAWMRAAGEGGIPASFIVGKDGKVAWIGHPMNLPNVLEQVVNDKFDVAAAREKRTQEVEVTRPIKEAMEGKKWDAAIKLIDATIKKTPQKAPLYTYDLLVAKFHAQPKVAEEDARKILEEAQGNIGAYRMIVSIAATYKDLSRPTYDFMQELAQEAIEKNEMRFMFLAMSAEVSMSQGNKAQAIKTQEEAIKAAEVEPHTTKEFVEFLKKNLEKMKAK